VVVQTLTRDSLLQASKTLLESDADLGRVLSTYGPPPLWARETGFATLVRIILEQQVSLVSADAMYRRLEDRLGELTPALVLEHGEKGLRALGVTRQKSSYFINLAGALQSGEVDLDAMDKEADGLVINKLTSIKGIGLWTAGIYLLMALRRPDAWPPGDIALMTAYKNLKGLQRRPGKAELDQVAEKWRPHRATAARLLWHFYLSEKANGNPAT